MNEDEPRQADGEGAYPRPEWEHRTGPRIYVASLADYNAGHLHGAWIDADQSVEELEKAIQEILRSSPSPGAEEWAIHDYEGFGPLRLSEYESLAYVARVAAGIEKHGLVFAAWTDHIENEDDLDAFEDAYFGCWTSLDEYGLDMLEDFGYLAEIERRLPEHLQPYVRIDAKGFAEDLAAGGDIVAIENPEGGVWIFDGR